MQEPGAPVKLTETELQKLTDHFSNELDEAMDAHEELEGRLDERDQAYRAEPKEKRKTFPWPGAANIEIPIIAIACDSIAARLLNTIFSVEPLWTATALRREVEAYAKPVEHSLDWSRKNEFDMYGTMRKSTNELIRHGWCWYKLGWEVFTQPVWTVGGGLEERVVRRPNIYHVLNRDMITQAGVEDDEQSEWIAQRFRLTDNQLRMRVHNGYYEEDDFDDFMEQKEDIYRVHQAMQSSSFTPPIAKEKLNTFYETCIDWPYGPDKIPTPMLATYHRPTKKFARLVFNPYGWRMHKKAKFIEWEGHSEGYGIAARLGGMQSEISTIHRQQLDNGTISNTKFFLGKRNVVRTNTPIWPGRVLGVNDPGHELKVMDLGTPGAFQAMRMLEMQALMYAERSSGVSDYQLGRESNIGASRATATGTLAIIQEGNRRFDLNIRDMRAALSYVGGRLLELNQIFRPRGMMYWVQGEEGRMTEAVLNLPPEFSASKLSIELTASTATVNRAVEKQELIALMGLTERYHQAMAQIAMVLFNPQVPGPAKEYFVKASKSATMLMRRVVQAFDQKSVNDLVPALVEDQEGGNAGQGGAQAEGFGNGGGFGYPPGNGSDGYMAGLPSV